MYLWTACAWSDDKPGLPVRLPADIRDELLLAVICLPRAETNVRWPISGSISATDATPSSGGAVHCQVAPIVAEAVFRTCEYKGPYVRLDTRGLLSLIPPDPLVGETLQSLSWRVRRSRDSCPPRTLTCRSSKKFARRRSELCAGPL